MRYGAGWMAAALVLCPTPLLAKSKAASLQGNPGEWFGTDQYPAEALRAQEQGRVVAILSIDATGAVTACKIDVSSGSPSLDKATCDISTAKGHFTPALNDRGKPIAVTYTLPVRWVLPEQNMPRFVTAQSVMRLELDASKKPLSCLLLSGSPVLKPSSTPCPVSYRDAAIPDMLLAPLVGKHVVTEQKFAVVRDGDTPFPVVTQKPDHHVTMLQRAHLVISPDGSVLECQVLQDIAPVSGLDACAKFGRFEPLRPGEDSKRAGTVETSFSVDPADDAK